jgi:hypothetical protein
LYQRAFGRRSRSQVVLPVPRGPSSRNERAGRTRPRVNIASIMTVKLLAVYTTLRQCVGGDRGRRFPHKRKVTCRGWQHFTSRDKELRTSAIPVLKRKPRLAAWALVRALARIECDIQDNWLMIVSLMLKMSACAVGGIADVISYTAAKARDRGCGLVVRSFQRLLSAVLRRRSWQRCSLECGLGYSLGRNCRARAPPYHRLRTSEE